MTSYISRLLKRCANTSSMMLRIVLFHVPRPPIKQFNASEKLITKSLFSLPSFKNPSSPLMRSHLIRILGDLGFSKAIAFWESIKADRIILKLHLRPLIQKNVSGISSTLCASDSSKIANSRPVSFSSRSL